MPEQSIQILIADDHPVFLFGLRALLEAQTDMVVVGEADSGETLRAIRAVANGEVIFSPGVAEQMMAFFMKGGRETATMDSAEADPFPELTPRERDILELLAQGLTNTAIAEKLVLSPKTIRNQVSNIFSKLQVASRSEAIVKAREAGLGKASE